MKIINFGIENRDQRPWVTSCSDQAIPLCPQDLVLTSPAGGGRSVSLACGLRASLFFVSIGRVTSYVLVGLVLISNKGKNFFSILERADQAPNPF
jgi:hypothetical protein